MTIPRKTVHTLHTTPCSGTSGANCSRARPRSHPLSWLDPLNLMMSKRFRPTGPVIDGHADTAQRFLDESWSLTGALGNGMLNLDTAQRGKLDAEFFAIWVDPSEHKGRFAHRALQLIDAVHEQLRRSPQQLALCLTAADIEQAFRSGRFGVLLGLEGGHCIEDDLALLRTYFRLGCRYMTLTWTNSVGWADSSGDAERDGVKHAHGLTAFGREVIREMNRLGMMIDISHVSDETFWAVIEQSSAPIIASHSSARAVTAAARNLTDEQLRAIRDGGGIVMVNFFSAFIDETWREAWNALKPERDKAHAELAAPFRARSEAVPFAVSNALDREFAARLPRAPFASLIDHFEHILRVTGSEHVGLGSDFDGIAALPGEIDSAADLMKIADALDARGFSAEEIQGVLGGNMLRVMRTVEGLAENSSNLHRDEATLSRH